MDRVFSSVLYDLCLLDLPLCLGQPHSVLHASKIFLLLIHFLLYTFFLSSDYGGPMTFSSWCLSKFPLFFFRWCNCFHFSLKKCTAFLPVKYNQFLETGVLYLGVHCSSSFFSLEMLNEHVMILLLDLPMYPQLILLEVLLTIGNLLLSLLSSLSLSNCPSLKLLIEFAFLF